MRIPRLTCADYRGRLTRCRGAGSSHRLLAHPDLHGDHPPGHPRRREPPRLPPPLSRLRPGQPPQLSATAASSAAHSPPPPAPRPGRCRRQHRRAIPGGHSASWSTLSASRRRAASRAAQPPRSGLLRDRAQHRFSRAAGARSHSRRTVGATEPSRVSARQPARALSVELAPRAPTSSSALRRGGGNPLARLWLALSPSALFRPGFRVLGAARRRKCGRSRPAAALLAGDPVVAGPAQRGQVLRAFPGLASVPVVHFRRHRAARLAPRERGELRGADRPPARRHRRRCLNGGCRCASQKPVSSPYSGQYRRRQPRTSGMATCPAPERAGSAAPGPGAGARDLAAGRPAGSRAGAGAAGLYRPISPDAGPRHVEAALGGSVMLMAGGCGRVMATTGTLSTHGGAAGSGSAGQRCTPWPGGRLRPERWR